MADRPKAKLDTHMMTDVGVVREHNEDSAHVDEHGEFFAVADGMGGHAAGEVASAMAIEEVKKNLEENRERIKAFRENPDEAKHTELVTLLEQAVRKAHAAVFDRGTRESDKKGMGTTLEVLLIAGADAFVAHVGDSRTYLVRDGRISQVTMDHTVAEVLVMEGKLSEEEALVSPLRTILVNAIGVAADVGVEMAHVDLRNGDKLLLCSDGLHDYFPDSKELGDKIAGQTPEEALKELTELAKERGGHDNITGIVVNVLEAPKPWRPEGAGAIATQRASSDDTLPVDDDETAGTEATIVGMPAPESTNVDSTLVGMPAPEPVNPATTVDHIEVGPRTDEMSTVKMPTLTGDDDKATSAKPKQDSAKGKKSKK